MSARVLLEKVGMETGGRGLGVGEWGERGLALWADVADRDCAGGDAYATGAGAAGRRRGVRACAAPSAHRQTGRPNVRAHFGLLRGIAIRVGGGGSGCHIDLGVFFELWLAVFAGIFEVAGVVVADLAADDAQHFRF